MLLSLILHVIYHFISILPHFDTNVTGEGLKCASSCIYSLVLQSCKSSKGAFETNKSFIHLFANFTPAAEENTSFNFILQHFLKYSINKPIRLYYMFI